MIVLLLQTAKVENLDQIIPACAKRRAAGSWAKQEERILVMTYDQVGRVGPHNDAEI